RNGVFFLADSHHAPTHHTGREFLPGCMMVYSAGAEHHHRSSTVCKWAAMSLPLEDLAAAGQAITGRDPCRPPAVARRARAIGGVMIDGRRNRGNARRNQGGPTSPMGG